VSDALDAVSAGPSSQQYFAYSDVSAVRDAAGTPDVSDATLRRWSVPLSLGAPALTQRGRRGELDVFSAERFLTVGAGGDNASRADGLEGDAKMLTEGVDASSSEDGTVAVGTSDQALDEVLGRGDAPLGDRDEYAAASGCLGDVVAAAVASVPKGDYDLVAIGTRGGDDPVDVLCIVGDAAQASRAADALGQTEELDGDEVTTGESGEQHWTRVVHATEEDEPLGFFYRSVFQALLLERWLGGDSAG
jgi:hypothetical protein